MRSHVSNHNPTSLVTDHINIVVVTQKTSTPPPPRLLQASVSPRPTTINLVTTIISHHGESPPMEHPNSLVFQ
jgi:hypothetical protein